MFPEQPLSIPLQPINDPLLLDRKLTLSVLRTDKTNPIISGNKWFKLKYNILEARSQGYKTLLSFGGPYSNHLHALATAGNALGFNTIGIIRGEEHIPLNPTLSDVITQGMKLYYINRQTYRNKRSPEVLDQLRTMIAEDDPFQNSEKFSNHHRAHKIEQQIPDKLFYVLPEGGTNALAVKGAADIANYIPADTDYACVPCGTGGTIAGIITGLSLTKQFQTKVLGFPALKGGEFLHSTIIELLSEQSTTHHPLFKLPQWQLFYDYHFGGFGKINQLLALFIQDFEKKQAIELDPIYTAKMMYAIVNLIKDDFFPEGSKIVAVHTGGLQGKRGMEESLQALLANALS